MSTWRVSKHYGFGAAQIPIQPEAHRASQASLSEAVADFSDEFFSGGPAAVARRMLGQSPAIVLGLLLVSTFFVTLLRDHSDRSAIEVVMFETPAGFEALPEPDPIPEPKAAPPPDPVPIARAEPKPAEVVPVQPPPPALAERVPPPPEATPLPQAKPKPPVVPQIARLETPTPPAPRTDRPERRPRPELAPKPLIALDKVARAEPKPLNLPRTERVQHEQSLARRSPMPRLDAPVAPKQEADQPPQPSRSFRTASAASPNRARRPQAVPGLAPAPAALDGVPTAPSRTRSTSAVARPNHRRASSAAPPAMAAARVSVPDSPAPSASARRAARALPTRSASSAPRPAAAPSRVPKSLAAAAPSSIQRVARARPSSSSSPSGSSNSKPGVDGVPLGSLAACLSDREEDRLKQAVVGAVTTQKECVSAAGTYRFIETKNLNSFLMSIDRTSGRSVGDRCSELRLALDCLKGS